ncbi:SufE family protein [Marinomonas rhizomae]|uniref:Cysteine desulfuration protein SufE n=1 Tax=Marinomonas rhizomae TaxID=491948 RepID=A0A366JH92_9GAMM|nr:SufE family protein [Marinomonas rhizomae]RBP85188.1 cysteine desulfuration protein SufE [Marinomonas rhizomae]RNF76292.1 SufE family protein [Marinomonas rhizomae]
MTDSLGQQKPVNIKAQLQACRSKEETFKTLVTLSKTLPRLPTEEKTEENKVKGCESAVWLIIEEKDGLRYFKADSDAKLMRGVLVAILSLVEGKTLVDIQKMDLTAELAELNLSSYLTSSRTNGVLAILSKINTL